ncbi:hypothetical protein [Nostoc sp. LPT]|uniref:hypothetical protein n=1 Tax=Nostoc sp. LPT TaxID=2815387 RepID=UPI001D2242A4|nr:hypothetical protein [Nostoc sp. LPT]MBN4002019.1 hypothetical protein [Nostoc sp. LPT]
MSTTGKVGLQLVGGQGEVTSTNYIKIRTTEEVTGNNNILGAFADSHDCYYWQDGYDDGKQSWKITKADGKAGSIFYGDRVCITNISYSNQRLAPDTKNQGYITTVKNASDSWILEPVFVRSVAQPTSVAQEPVAQEPVFVQSDAQQTPVAHEPVSLRSVALPTPDQVKNQYQVQIQTDGSWHDDGIWVIGLYDFNRTNKTGIINSINIKSNDDGKTLVGNYWDGISDELIASTGSCQATRSTSRNSYTVVETAGNSPREFTWVLGSRTNKDIVEINVESKDGGQTLNGTITYKDEKPISFKGVVASIATTASIETAKIGNPSSKPMSSAPFPWWSETAK